MLFREAMSASLATSRAVTRTGWNEYARIQITPIGQHFGPWGKLFDIYNGAEVPGMSKEEVGEPTELLLPMIDDETIEWHVWEPPTKE